MNPAVSWPDLAPAWRRAALAGWLVAILAVAILSLHPKAMPPTAAHADKLFHFAAYAALGALPHVALLARGAARAGALAMLPFGLLVEVAQGFVPGRYADPWDGFANAFGVLVGLALGAPFRRLAVAFVARSVR